MIRNKRSDKYFCFYFRFLTSAMVCCHTTHRSEPSKWRLGNPLLEKSNKSGTKLLVIINSNYEKIVMKIDLEIDFREGNLFFLPSGLHIIPD